MTVIQAFTTVVNVCMLFMVVDFLRREKLKEKYALLWLAAVLGLQGLIFQHGWVEWLAQLFGVYYPPALLFYLAVLFLFVIVLHLCLVVSRLTRQCQILAQRLALLEGDRRPPGQLGRETDRPSAGGVGPEGGGAP